MRSRHTKRLAIAAVGLLAAGVAWASPWDIDMINAYTYKAYEWKMFPQVKGSVARDPVGPKVAGAYQTAYIQQVDRTNPAIDTLVDPYPVDEASVAQGKRLFQVTCAPCHGPEGKGGGPVTYNDPEKGIRRFPLAAPLLSGAGAVTAVRSDGYIYGTIRNGGSLMPAYGVSLTDQERWSIISYIRTLEGAKYTPPASPAQSTGGTP